MLLTDRVRFPHISKSQTTQQAFSSKQMKVTFLHIQSQNLLQGFYILIKSYRRREEWSESHVGHLLHL